MKFRVESLFDLEEHAWLLARQMEHGTFSLSPTPRLGGVVIRHFVEQPRKLKPDGSPDFDVFAFELGDRRDRARFSVGQIVELDS